MRVWVASLLACAGCGLTLDLEPPRDGGGGVDFGVERRDLGAPDLAVPDAGAVDASRPDLATADLGSDDGGPAIDAATCVETVERCNGVDDDCDDAIDEDFDLLTDLGHCGACGRVCEGRGGTPSCVDGDCLLECDPGRDDCDDDLANGCETDLSSRTDCGACDRTCAASTPSCVPSGGAYTCGVECGVGQTLCDGSCVDLYSNTSHCGACGDACFLDPHGRLTCNDGDCVVDDCGDNHADCNDDPSDGCEQPLNTADHCGSCGSPCGADAVCVAGLCTAAVPGG
jgi:hypothetical protein